MPTTVTPFPPAPPTISGENITMSVWLNSPARIQKSLERLSLQRFLADQIFATGPAATAGAVVYDQIVANNLFTARDVQEIKPNSEFPIVNGEEPNPLIALVTKWGGSAVFSYELIRRNRLDVLRKELIRLRNTIYRKVDTAAMAVLNAAPLLTDTASADWSSTGDIIGDIETGKSMIEKQDMGYVVNTAIIHPDQALDIRTNEDVRNALPRENRKSNLLDGTATDMAGLCGIENWLVSNRQTAGTFHLLDNTQVGFISDEIPGPYSRIVDEETKERKRVMAARVPTMGVTDPKAALRVTGA